MEWSFTSGYQELEVVHQDHIQFHATQNAQVFISIKEGQSLKIEGTVDPGIALDLFYWNDTEQDLVVEENYTVQEAGQLRIAYGELGPGKVQRQSAVQLEGPYAKGSVFSALLCGTEKKEVLSVVNGAPHTEGDMTNFSVVLQGAKSTVEATGKIVKGAHGAKSHQSSRSLTFDEGQTSTILPVLLIDENDVEASHATSIGQADPDQMLYMQSRGLTPQMIVSLLTLGYLLPITRFIENEELNQKLTTIVERKVAEACSTSQK